MLNEELAAGAVAAALKDRGLAIDEVGMLAAGTTQGDLLVPGFASMVHGRLDERARWRCSPPAASARRAWPRFAAAARAIAAGDHDAAVVVGSELVSRSLRAPVEGKRNADAEFLRWTLSDGAGAVVLQNSAPPARASPAARLDPPGVLRPRAPGLHERGRLDPRPGRPGSTRSTPDVSAGPAASGRGHAARSVPNGGS